MEPADLRRYFDAYWDAGWQIHIHVNGDLGLDVFFDIIDDAMTRLPRIDHRTTIVHFATPPKSRWNEFPASVRSCLPTPSTRSGFADKYSEYGLGANGCDHGCGCEVANFVFDHLAQNGFAA